MGVERGATLGELLVALAIAATVLASALPAFSRLLPRLELEAACDELVQDLALARLKAIERRTATSVRFDAAARGWVMEPWRLRRRLPASVAVEVFEPLTFDAGGMLAPAAPVTIAIGGRGGRRTIAVSAAGRIRVGR